VDGRHPWFTTEITEEPAIRLQIFERTYGKSENSLADEADKPVAKPPELSPAGPEAPRPENKATAKGLFPEPTIKTRPLTKAEQKKFQEVSLRIKGNREAGGTAASGVCLLIAWPRLPPLVRLAGIGRSAAQS